MEGSSVMNTVCHEQHLNQLFTWQWSFSHVFRNCGCEIGGVNMKQDRQKGEEERHCPRVPCIQDKYIVCELLKWGESVPFVCILTGVIAAERLCAAKL